jgi:hypothetical protein
LYLKEKVKIMGNKKFNLTKLALAVGVTVGLAGCFSDNDNNVDIKPTPKKETQKVADIPEGTSAVKQAGFFTIAVKDVAGNNLGTQEVPVTVKITKNGDNVVTTKGEALTADSLKITSGLGLFAASLKEVTEAGTDITVNFSADGFFNNSTVVSLSTDNTEVAATVTLTPRGAVEGVAIAATEIELDETVTFADDGTLSTADGKPITLEQKVTKADSTEKDDKGGVAVSIPSGSKMLTRNAEGALVPLAGKPKLAVAYFNNEASTTAAANADNATAAEQTRTTSTLDFFPGGLDLAVAVPASDEAGAEDAPQAGSFTTAGFVAIELTDEEGNKVKQFGDSGETDANGDPIPNSIEVAMQVDVNTANSCPMNYTGDLAQDAVKGFATDSAKATNGAYFRKGACVSSDGTPIVTRTIEEGDIVPVWSYDADEATWTFESYGVAQKNETNADVFDVAVKVTHLSYWNLDFFNWREPNRGQCGTNGKVQFDIKYANGETDNVTAFDLLVESQSGGYRKYKRGYEFPFFNKATIANPPSFSVFMQLVNDGTNVVDGILDKEGNSDPQNPVDQTATRLKLDDVCELDGKTVVLTLETPPAKVDLPVKTQLVCGNTDDFDVAPEPVATSTYVYVLDTNNNFVTYAYTGNDGKATVNNLKEGTYKLSAYDVNTFNFITGEEFTVAEDSVTEQTIDLPTTCTVTEREVTGTGSGS